VIAAALVIASGICLYFALTQPIVISRLASLNQIIRVAYPEKVFDEQQAAAAAKAAAAGQPAPAPPAAAPAAPGEPVLTPYEKRVAFYENLFTTALLNTDTAKKNFESLTSPTGYTAWQSARVLYDAGDKVSATLIIAFSIVYPVAKTLGLLVLILLGARHKQIFRVLEWTHKYTMLDVFVAALTLVAASTQKLLVIDTGPAVVWYVAYLVIGFASVMVLLRAKPRELAVDV